MVTGAVGDVATLMPRLLSVYALDCARPDQDPASTLAAMQRVEVDDIPNDRVRGEPIDITSQHGQPFGLGIVDRRRVVAGHDLLDRVQRREIRLLVGGRVVACSSNSSTRSLQ